LAAFLVDEDGLRGLLVEVAEEGRRGELLEL
jgi:hypothetical protein